MKYVSIFSVTVKSAITPSFMGRMARMLPGVRPSMSLASLPTASTLPVFWLTATIEGSETTIPLPFANTRVLAVPRSIARSLENRLIIDRGDQDIPFPLASGLPVMRSKGHAGLDSSRPSPSLAINLFRFGGHLNAVLGSLLHAVHRLVGLADQLLPVASVLRKGGDPEGGRDLDGQPHRSEEDMLRQPRPQALRQHPRLLRSRLGHHDGELVPPVAGHDVGLADLVAQQAAHLRQRPAPRQMAVGVVDRLETVEVEEDDRDRLPVALRPLDLPSEKRVQIARVVEARRVVGHRQLLQPLEEEGG